MMIFGEKRFSRRSFFEVLFTLDESSMAISFSSSSDGGSFRGDSWTDVTFITCLWSFPWNPPTLCAPISRLSDLIGYRARLITKIILGSKPKYQLKLFLISWTEKGPKIWPPVLLILTVHCLRETFQEKPKLTLWNYQEKNRLSAIWPIGHLTLDENFKHQSYPWMSTL